MESVRSDDTYTTSVFDVEMMLHGEEDQESRTTSSVPIHNAEESPSESVAEEDREMPGVFNLKY